MSLIIILKGPSMKAKFKEQFPVPKTTPSKNVKIQRRVKNNMRQKTFVWKPKITLKSDIT